VKFVNVPEAELKQLERVIDAVLPPASEDT